ncbi:MAG TPA: hypothetical protein VMC43_01855 [Candidatus Paceibacterota bacterium]|nr:hypothetical protein [Candidatus Paceibacterota bacterium]
MSRRRAGTTFIELAIVLAMIIIFAAVLFLSPSQNRDRRTFDGTVNEVATLLHEAQARAMSQSSSTTWGVHFENITSTTPFFVLFYGSYSTSTKMGQYPLPSGVQYLSSSLALGAVREISFAQITGSASASSSIVLVSTRLTGVSSTIAVASSGVVFY